MAKKRLQTRHQYVNLAKPAELRYNKQLLDEVSVISRVIKVEVRVISRPDRAKDLLKSFSCVLAAAADFMILKKHSIVFLPPSS